MASRVSSGRLRCVEQRAIAWCAKLAAGSPGGAKRENRGCSGWVAGRTAALLVRLDEQRESGCSTSTASVCPSVLLPKVALIAGEDCSIIFRTCTTTRPASRRVKIHNLEHIHQRKEAPASIAPGRGSHDIHQSPPRSHPRARDMLFHTSSA